MIIKGVLFNRIKTIGCPMKPDIFSQFLPPFYAQERIAPLALCSFAHKKRAIRSKTNERFPNPGNSTKQRCESQRTQNNDV